MRRRIVKARFLALGIGSILLGAMAIAPRIANSAGAVPSDPQVEGSAIAIALRIVDERAAPSRQGEDFAPGTELVPVLLRKQVAAYLRRQGFVVTDFSDSAPRSLSIEIRTFEYERMSGGLAIGIRSEFRAVAIREGRAYERVYWAKVPHHVYVMPSRSNNEDWVRLGLSDVMPPFYKDTRLSGLLTGH
jgi:hypothetical protein